MMKKLLGVAGVVLVLGIVYLVVRTDEKDKTKTDPSTTSSSVSSTSSSSSSSSSSGGTSGTQANASSSGEGTSGSPSANPSDGSVGVITSGQPVDMEQLLLEAKYVESARTALANGNPKKAMEDLDFYFKIPNPNGKSLRQEATLLKIEALAQVGRKAEARSLAYSTRDDPSFDTYQGRIEALLNNQK